MCRPVDGPARRKISMDAVGGLGGLGGGGGGGCYNKQENEWSIV